MKIRRTLSERGWPRDARSGARRVLPMLALAATLFAMGAGPAAAMGSTNVPSAHPTATTNTPGKPAPGGIHGGETTPAPRAGTSTPHPLGVPWALTLTATPSQLWENEDANILATANQPLPAGYSIYIYESSQSDSPPQWLTTCDTSPCPWLQSSTFFGMDVVAFIATKSGSTDYPPPGVILAKSNDLTLNWQVPTPVGMSASAYTLPVGASSTLTASTTFDIKPTPYYTQIWDTTTSPATLLETCSSGTSCANSGSAPVTVTQNVAGTRTYVATLAASNGASYPPPKLESSWTNYVTWNNLGWSVSLSASPSAPVVTATTNKAVDQTPYAIYIYDEDTNQIVASCTHGSTCDYDIPNCSNPHLVALVASIDVVATSNTVSTHYPCQTQ